MFQFSPFEMFVAFLVLHCLADYPLQGPFLSEAKNPNTALGREFWPYAMSAHALIHGGAVFLLTGSVWLCLVEAVVHAVTDLLKCDNKLTMFGDQLIHVLCKVVWLGIFFAWIKPV